MSRTIDIADAKAQFSDLVTQAEIGADIVIVRNGVPIARIAPLNRPVAETIALLRKERTRRPRVSAVEIRAARDRGRA
ncbi:MAG: type II toxin-antitoxin system prevent-host-death family antitoxin [Rhodospirillaceae bacterium]|nr:type II toxin-antitoxin system prevent-host-death family antitoxin [Rhodospirillaceae bacterium]MYB14122.1 type II toxin-antitoxin system prevent-host-death family antitoxin [Rhodospirillaceae bacterium]MYI49599.1 type II toxin-antitoxin system prevent-host-death family antitoxin [Rhodospirillaceae bacterium]